MSNIKYNNIEYYKSELTKKDEIIEKLFDEVDNLKDTNLNLGMTYKNQLENLFIQNQEFKEITHNLKVENENLKKEIEKLSKDTAKNRQDKIHKEEGILSLLKNSWVYRDIGRDDKYEEYGDTREKEYDIDIREERGGIEHDRDIREEEYITGGVEYDVGIGVEYDRDTEEEEYRDAREEEYDVGIGEEEYNVGIEVEYDEEEYDIGIEEEYDVGTEEKYDVGIEEEYDVGIGEEEYDEGVGEVVYGGGIKEEYEEYRDIREEYDESRFRYIRE